MQAEVAHAAQHHHRHHLHIPGTDGLGTVWVQFGILRRQGIDGHRAKSVFTVRRQPCVCSVSRVRPDWREESQHM